MTDNTLPNRTALIRLFFGDGEHDFRIKFEQLEEHYEKLGKGPMRVLMGFESGDWTAEEVFQTIRLGLIGGGKTPSEAFGLAMRYCAGRPIAESAPVALSVLSAALMGAPPVEAEAAANG